VPEIEHLGARRTAVLYYAADPSLFAPVEVEPDIDVFFYGHGQEYREQWIHALLSAPSRALPDVRFAVRGKGLTGLGRVDTLPYLSFSRLKEYCCRSRINLLITRQAHASVRGSSTARIFELAALGRAMVSNPYAGVEEWFEPGREIIIVGSAEEAIDAYRWLLRDDSARAELGERARQRFLAQHTYAHRAQDLLEVLSPVRARA
jgi:spore maturation protein CgeB